MTLYMFTALLIVIPGLFYHSRPSITIKDAYRRIEYKVRHVTIEDIHILVITVILIFIMANRADTSTDANNYRLIFQSAASIQSFTDLITHDRIEIGYKLLNKIISLFTTDYYWVQVITTMVIILPVIYISRKSKCAWLSLFLYFVGGTYFQAFNVIRHMLSISVFYIGVEGIYTGDIKKYFIATFVGSLKYHDAKNATILDKTA